MTVKFVPWDCAEILQTEEDILAFIEAALEENDPAFFAHALGIVARARGMTDIAKKSGLSRESLYKALSSEGNPSFDTIMKVMKALDLELHVGAATPAAAE